MHVGFRVKCLLILSGFNQNWNVSEDLLKLSTKYHDIPSSCSGVVRRGQTSRQTRQILHVLFFFFFAYFRCECARKTRVTCRSRFITNSVCTPIPLPWITLGSQSSQRRTANLPRFFIIYRLPFIPLQYLNT
jgi:hypothetical protein